MVKISKIDHEILVKDDGSKFAKIWVDYTDGSKFKFEADDKELTDIAGELLGIALKTRFISNESCKKEEARYEYTIVD